MADGKTRNDKLFRQRITFASLRIGKDNTYSTDIDGVYGKDGKLWLFFEIKHKSKDTNTGQNILFQRTVDALDSINGKHAYAIVADHDVGPDNDIEAGECLVRCYYHKGQWLKPKQPIILRDAANLLYGKHINESR